MEIKRILLPFDGSDHSIRATSYVLNLARLSGAHVTIVNCYEWLGDVSEIQGLLSKDLISKAKMAAEETLKKAEEIFAKQEVEYKLEIVAGSAGYMLARLARSKEYDMIVMGSHGHSDIAGLFLGSVTHKVLNKIYCPVLIVP